MEYGLEGLLVVVCYNPIRVYSKAVPAILLKQRELDKWYGNSCKHTNETIYHELLESKCLFHFWFVDTITSDYTKESLS